MFLRKSTKAFVWQVLSNKWHLPAKSIKRKYYQMKYGKLMLIAFGLFWFQGPTAHTQHFEVGIGGGITNFYGDLSEGTFRDITRNTHVGVTGFGKYHISPTFNVGLSISHGRISGDDRFAEDEETRMRNLSFQSPVTEVALRLDINLLGFEPYNFRSPWSPYIFGGIAGFRFQPEALYEGEWVELQPLGTEGQGLDAFPDREKYNLVQISVPLGFGFKYALSEFLTIGFEFGYRLTFTDYLDDVSTNYVPYSLMLEERGEVAAALSDRSWEYLGQEPMDREGPRGNPDKNDGYIFTVLTLSYHFLDTGLAQSRQRRPNRTGCPSGF